MIVFLIGFMGAGKTTLGKATAQALGCPFIDLDTEIESHTGQTIAQLFSQQGEDAFRILEQETLIQTVHRQASEIQNHINHCLISCGGGTPCYKDNIDFMKAHGFVIYLEVAPEILCERLLNAPPDFRPLLPFSKRQPLLQHIRTLLNARLPYYEAAHWKC